ncbi:AraC family transcriptional regulator [Reyranella sp. CPCC 100927]|uniref:AraC family transcriptional regulator n=1 Tax=Reyranella sp. CPCC 100927 TaxID=2599616 RepID=UPI0011B4B5D9|nr:AraC family transcriptional regulator [Reyranella sp. CPCC 100927]TWT05103.1 AraC family transcriptional regulator [Reyranella sp. CPCC 100927]
MDGITQAEAVAATPLAAGERARFFMAGRFDGLECLAATFRTHRYALHIHDTYVVGGILAGCETWNVRGSRRYATPGDLVFNHPHDVHDGEAYGGGYCYRMTYPSVVLLQGIAMEVSGVPVVGTPWFPEPVVHDPHGVALISAAHSMLEEEGATLAADELLSRAYAHCLVRHARIVPAPLGRERGPVARVKTLLEQRHAEDLPLSLLAAEAGLSPYHLIRAFRRETGLTPHAWLINLRVEAAKIRLRRGETPVVVASATGFCDQAHLTRAFKARIGVTPGAYRTAVVA